MHYTILFDVEQKRPACVLLQAACNCGISNPAFRLFSSESWITHPTKGMRKVTGTLEEWKKIADLTNQSL